MEVFIAPPFFIPPFQKTFLKTCGLRIIMSEVFLLCYVVHFCIFVSETQ